MEEKILISKIMTYSWIYKKSVTRYDSNQDYNW